jgi:hypothetical protein
LDTSRRWKLWEVASTTSLVLKKTGKLSNNGYYMVCVFGPGRYDPHDPAEIPELFRPLIIEHAPRPLRGPDEKRSPPDTTEISVGDRVQIRRTPFERTWPGFFDQTGTVVDTCPGDCQITSPTGKYVYIYRRGEPGYEEHLDRTGANVRIGPEEYGVVFDGDEYGYIYWFRRRQLDRLL